MPKITGGLLAAVAVVVMLTGCAGTAIPTGTVGVGTEKVGPAETDAPLTAETSAASPAPGDASAADAFLREVRSNLPANTQIPNATDQQLLDAGRQACERLAAGEASDQISVIEGETRNGADLFGDSAAIVTAARSTICG